MTKAQMKQNTDRHIAMCGGVKTNKRKGYREGAWVECKALEKIMKASKE